MVGTGIAGVDIIGRVPHNVSLGFVVFVALRKEKFSHEDRP